MLDFGGVFEEVHVTKHHDTGEKESCRVGLTVNDPCKKPSVEIRDIKRETSPRARLGSRGGRGAYPCPAISGADP